MYFLGIELSFLYLDVLSDLHTKDILFYHTLPKPVKEVRERVSPYEKKVRHRLIDLGQSQTWLIEQVKAATGMYCDSSLLHKMYAGKLKVPNIRRAVDQVLGIKEE